MPKEAEPVKSVLYRHYLKRALDFLFSLLLILVLLIPGLVVAVMIKATAPSEPVFFRQKRVGKDNFPFQIYKFRTMSSQAPHTVATSDFVNPNDYITPVGRFLRKTSIDELPQLVNVLKGEMSIIGPRPLIPAEKAILAKRTQLGANQVLPGITGLAQVSGRDEVSDSQKAQLDAEYVHNLSLSLDAKILLKTLVVVLEKKGFHEGRDWIDHGRADKQFLFSLNVDLPRW